MRRGPALLPGIAPDPTAYAHSIGGEAMTPEEMERFLNARQNSGEEELVDELKRMTREQEQRGQMSSTRMEEIYDTLSPFLSERQREKMREVIRRLKS